jgi:hypothetical protein
MPSRLLLPRAFLTGPSAARRPITPPSRAAYYAHRPEDAERSNCSRCSRRMRTGGALPERARRARARSSRP